MKNYNLSCEISKAKLCAYLSMIAYEEDEVNQKSLLKRVTGLEVNIINRNRKNLQYTVIEIPQVKHVFIAVRGTDTSSIKESARDFYISAKILARKINGHKVHSGYAKYGRKLLKEMEDIIHSRSDYKIVFTGHSLGGVLAQFISMESNIECECYTYGSPRLAERSYYESNKKVFTRNFINARDPFTKWYPRYSQNTLEGVLTKFGEGGFPKLHLHSIKSYIRRLNKLEKGE